MSKPPKAGTLLHSFYRSLEEVAAEAGVEVTMVHRKINLQDTRQPWEHHKYSMRRLPAATLSALPSPDEDERGTFLDTQAAVDMDRLVRHTTVLNKALIRHIYSNTFSEEEQRNDERSVLSFSYC